MDSSKDVPILPFASQAAWESWLEEHFADQTGVWLKMAKKASGIPSITYAEALDVALCFGWIDGQRRSLDETYFLQRFTPRRARSLWSQRNIGKITELEAQGRMRPSGIVEVERAKADGRWEAAYASAATSVFPEDFLQAVEASPTAHATFTTLKSAAKFSITFRLATAKTPQTRERRFQSLLKLLEEGRSP